MAAIQTLGARPDWIQHVKRSEASPNNGSTASTLLFAYQPALFLSAFRHPPLSNMSCYKLALTNRPNHGTSGASLLPMPKLGRSMHPSLSPAPERPSATPSCHLSSMSSSHMHKSLRTVATTQLRLAKVFSVSANLLLNPTIEVLTIANFLVLKPWLSQRSLVQSQHQQSHS